MTDRERVRKLEGAAKTRRIGEASEDNLLAKALGFSSNSEVPIEALEAVIASDEDLIQWVEKFHKNRESLVWVE